jgi:hypothetical protein
MSLQLIAPADLNVATLLRTADVETCQGDGLSAVTITSGTFYGALAICRAAGIYTKIGFVHTATTPSLTELRAGVHDPTTTNWARVTDSGDIKASVSAGTVGLPIEVPLAASVSLARGQAIGLSLGGAGATMPQVGGNGTRMALLDKATAVGPKRGRNATGYASGNVPTLDSAPASNTLVYVYLLP